DFHVETSHVDDSGRILQLRDPGGERVTGRVRIHGGNVADNAALAFAALRAMGVATTTAAERLDALDVLERRLELVGCAGGVRVFDDLGKHPEAVAANIAGLRELRPRALHVLYEPTLDADVLRWGRRWGDVLREADTSVLL